MNAASSSAFTMVHTPWPALAYGTLTTAMPPMRFTHSGICASKVRHDQEDTTGASCLTQYLSPCSRSWIYLSERLKTRSES